MKNLSEYLDEFFNGYFIKEDTMEGFVLRMKPAFGVGSEAIVGDLGVYYAYFGDMTFNKDIIIRHAINEKYVVITHCASGEALSYTKLVDANYIDPGLSAFFNLPPLNVYAKLKANKRLIMQGLCMRESFFESLPFELPKDYWERSAKAFNEGAVDHPELFKLCNELNRRVSQLSGAAAKAYVYAKCVEATSIMLDLVYQSETKLYPKLSAEDRESLRQAREILESSLKDPPTIQELARKVGMNQQKLMKGFRQLSDTTVHGYLTQLRMRKAACLLRSSDMKVVRIAQEVGYHGDGHFQKIFTAAFNMTPIEYRKRMSEDKGML